MDVAITDDDRQRYHGWRLRKGRWSDTGRIYLVTAVTRDREPVFADWGCALACSRALHRAPRDGLVSPLCWVVMPDHVHWLFALESGDLSGAMRRFKSRASHAINRARDSTGPVWQRGYHDRAVRRQTDVRALARYVVANPLRAGLCERIGDYPFWDAAWL